MNRIWACTGRTLKAAWSVAPPLAVMAAALPAFGQSAGSLRDLSLEQLMEIKIEKVFGASKYEQTVTRAPAAVTIVTANEIEKFGHRTLGEVLRSVRGLYVSDDGNYSYLGTRGFLRPGDFNTRTLVLIDGHRMNDAIYDFANLGHENMLDVAAIERVEVVRGPSSSIYGSSAFFGVVNIVTKQAAQFHGAEISGEAGSFGSYKERFSYGKLFGNGVELVFNASYYRSGGREQIYYPELDQRISLDPRANHDGIAQDMDAETAVNFSGNLKLSEVTISAFFSSRRKFIPTASFSTVFNDGREETTDSRGYVDFRFEHDIGADLRLVARAYYDRSLYNADYPVEIAAPGADSDVVIFKDHGFGEWMGTELQMTAKILGRHTLVVGGEFRYLLHQEQTGYNDTTPREYTINDDHKSSIAGLYAQGEFSLRSDLLFNAGLRYDYYRDSFGGTLNPRFGLIYNPWRNTTFKALYGQAFRAPNAYEFSLFGKRQSPLTPEKIRTTELVLEHYFAHDYRLEISGYRYDVRDLITQVAAPGGEGFDLGTEGGGFYFANRDRTSAQGIEFELAGNYASGVQVRTSYALQRTEDAVTRQVLTSSPRHLAKLNVIWPLVKERLVAGLELQYHGSVRTLANATAADFLVGNLTFTSRGLIRGLELSATIYNLLDTQYGYPGAEDHTQDVLLQPGRSVRMRLAYRF